MYFRIGFRQKLAARISRLMPRHTKDQHIDKHDRSTIQALYESIAVGNALAELEDDANRYWRSS